MGRQRTFSDYELGEKLKQGLSAPEIAAAFGVQESAVYKRLRARKAAISQEAGAHAEEVFAQEMDAGEQLLKINRTANQLLDLLMSMIEGKYVMPPQVQAEMEASQGGDDNAPELAAEGDGVSNVIPFALIGAKSGMVEAVVKIKAEIRAQLKLLLEIHESLFNIKELQKFKYMLVEEIGVESPECQERIYRRLKSSDSLRLIIGGSGAEAAG